MWSEQPGPLEMVVTLIVGFAVILAGWAFIVAPLWNAFVNSVQYG